MIIGFYLNISTATSECSAPKVFSGTLRTKLEGLSHSDSLIDDHQGFRDPNQSE